MLDPLLFLCPTISSPSPELSQALPEKERGLRQLPDSEKMKDCMSAL